jgi:hypothetical protein
MKSVPYRDYSTFTLERSVSEYCVGLPSVRRMELLVNPTKLMKIRQMCYKSRRINTLSTKINDSYI